MRAARIFLVVGAALLLSSLPDSALSAVQVQQETYQWRDTSPWDPTDDLCLHEDDEAFLFAVGSLAPLEVQYWSPAYENCGGRYAHGLLRYSATKRKDRPRFTITLSARESLRTGEPPPSATFTDDGVQRASKYDCGRWRQCYVAPFCLHRMGSYTQPGQLTVAVRNAGPAPAELSVLLEDETYPWGAPQWQGGACPGQY